MRQSYHTGQKQTRRHYWYMVQPSLAASERVFSLLNNTFGKRQNSSLEDYVESCIMLQYNNHGIFGHKIGHNRAKIMARP